MKIHFVPRVGIRPLVLNYPVSFVSGSARCSSTLCLFLDPFAGGLLVICWTFSQLKNKNNGNPKKSSPFLAQITWLRNKYIFGCVRLSYAGTHRDVIISIQVHFRSCGMTAIEMQTT